MGSIGATTAAPTILTVDPQFGVPGTQVTLTGSGFNGTTSVEMGEQVPAEFDILSNNMLRVIVPPDGITAPIRVNTTSGSSSSTATFFVSARIESFFPPQGAPGTTVTINGANFLDDSVGGTRVVFGSITSQVVNVTAPTQLQAQVPAGATNSILHVFTGAGGSTSVVEFISTTAPLITEFFPENGLPNEAVNLTIRGANLGAATSVSFNNQPASFVPTADTLIIVERIPAGATSGKIKVVTPFGEAESDFDFIVGPTITSIEPAAGEEGQTISIFGNSLNGIGSVFFNDVPASFANTAPNLIRAVVPIGATTGRIRLEGPGLEATSDNDFVVGPLIADFNPKFAPVGTQIQIDGAGFVQGETRVFFGNIEAFNPQSAAPNIITALVPVGATNAPISVVSPTATNTTAQTFFVTTGIPFIDSFSPNSGPTGTEITLQGADFQDITSVTFGGVAAGDFSSGAPTQLKVKVPAGAITGPIRVSNGNGTGTSFESFFASPRVTGFSPPSAIANTPVTISGSNLSDATAVYFGGERVSIIAADPDALFVSVTANARSGQLKIDTPGGTFITTSNFTVLPNVIDFTPKIGPVGTEVTVSGTSFFDVTSVSFNGTEATFDVVSSQTIETTVPAGATTGLIRVETPDGEAFSADAFDVTMRTDLAVTELVSTNFVPPSVDVTYLSTITNRGPSNVTGVTYTNAFPSSTTVRSASASAGGCLVDGSEVSCDFGVMLTNSVVTVSIVASHGASGLYTNFVNVASIEGDSTVNNNSTRSVVAVATDAERTLNIRLLSASEAELSWEASLVPFRLQYLLGFGQVDVGWSNSLASPIENDGINRLTNAVSETTEFYRLIYPEPEN